MDPQSEVCRLLAGAQRIVILAHIMPDGDTIGATLGLSWALRRIGRQTRVACADPVPAELTFLPGAQDITAEPPRDEDLIVAVDASDLARVGSLYDEATFSRVPVLNIDHHITNVRYGQVNLVLERSSTAEIILQVVDALGITLDATVATCLLTGVITDTRGFRTSNTTPPTFEAAMRLTRAGASLTAITDAVFNSRSMEIIRLWGAAFSQAHLEEGILWIEVSQDMLASAGADALAAKGLVNFLSTVHEARIAATFREQADGRIDVSLRSVPGVNVAQVALRLGGGGHPQASGCLVPGALADVRQKVLAELKSALAAAGTA